MFTRSAALLAAAAVAWLGATAATTPTPEPTMAAYEMHHPVIYEDDPLQWNCHTMGNRICGPMPVGTEVTINGHPWVVTVTGLEPDSAN